MNLLFYNDDLEHCDTLIVQNAQEHELKMFDFHVQEAGHESDTSCFRNQEVLRDVTRTGKVPEKAFIRGLP